MTLLQSRKAILADPGLARPDKDLQKIVGSAVFLSSSRFC